MRKKENNLSKLKELTYHDIKDAICGIISFFLFENNKTA